MKKDGYLDFEINFKDLSEDFHDIIGSSHGKNLEK